MTYEEVVGLLGEPDQPLSSTWRSETKRAGWRDGALAVHFKPAVVFIEFTRGGGLTAWLEGVNIFGTPADEVVNALTVSGHRFDADDPELGHSYVFKDLDSAVWRQVVPEDGRDEDGRFFDTVSVGEKGYFS